MAFSANRMPFRLHNFLACPLSLQPICLPEMPLWGDRGPQEWHEGQTEAVQQEEGEAARNYTS